MKEMIVPCYAYVTFKKIEGVSEALSMSKKHKFNPFKNWKKE